MTLRDLLLLSRLLPYLSMNLISWKSTQVPQSHMSSHNAELFSVLSFSWKEYWVLYRDETWCSGKNIGFDVSNPGFKIRSHQLLALYPQANHLTSKFQSVNWKMGIMLSISHDYFWGLNEIASESVFYIFNFKLHFFLLLRAWWGGHIYIKWICVCKIQIHNSSFFLHYFI